MNVRKENPDGITRETRRTISFEREQLKEVFNYKLSKTYRISEKGNKAILNWKRKKYTKVDLLALYEYYQKIQNIILIINNSRLGVYTYRNYI